MPLALVIPLRCVWDTVIWFCGSDVFGTAIEAGRIGGRLDILGNQIAGR
jgi:hypothetical protein